MPVNLGVGQKQQGLKELKENYKLNEHSTVLGSTTSHKTFLSRHRHNLEMLVVIKVIDKSKLTPNDLKILMEQVTLLRLVDHPNIVKYYETYDDKDYLYLVIEYVKGKSLFETISEPHKHLNEDLAC
jgi:serine/threonine protein kinase